MCSKISAGRRVSASKRYEVELRQCVNQIVTRFFIIKDIPFRSQGPGAHMAKIYEKRA